MCGISGLVSPRRDTLLATISRMVCQMRHRGPEAESVYVDEIDDFRQLALGHNRLSILDLSCNAAQPMKSQDGRHVLVFNGEVYNYREIAAQLDASELPAEEYYGDTAIVLAALRKWGPQALSKFNGMWALLFYDAQQKTLLVSRDRFGIKPLYYHQYRGELFFASEIKAILAARQSRFAVNPDVAVPFLTRGLVDFSDQTFFVGVQQFPAASFALLNLLESPEAVPGTCRYWLHPVERGEEPAIGAVSPEEIREVFLDAVSSCLRSDVPVGILLSGGVDSSAIVGAAAQSGALDAVRTFSVISDDPAISEERFVDLMAARYPLLPVKINVSHDPLRLLDRVSEACWYNDGPIASIEEVAHLPLMEAARSRGIKVLLCGQGADEQLGGYSKFFFFWLREMLGSGNYWGAITTFLQVAQRTTIVRDFQLSEAMRYIGRAWMSKHSFIAPSHQRRDTVDLGSHGSYGQREWVDLRLTSLPKILHSEDRMSMARSVEMRVPFLDHRLVERLARVHPSEKFKGGWTKRIFRDAVADLLPMQIRFRRDKNGFEVPQDAWVRGVFRQRFLEMLHGAMRAEELGFISAPALRRAYRKFLAGRGYLNGRHFFRAYAFEIFLRHFEALGGLG